MTTPSFNSTEFDCTETEAHLPLFVGGDLDSSAMSAVHVHVLGCAPCQASLSALRSALAAFEVERERHDPVVNLWPGIEAELERVGVLGRATGGRASGGRASGGRASEADSWIAGPSARASAARSGALSSSASGLDSRRSVWRQVASFAAAAAIVVVAVRSWAGDRADPSGVVPQGVLPVSIEPSAPFERAETAFADPSAQGDASAVESVALVSDTTPNGMGVERAPSEGAHSADVQFPSAPGLRRLAPGEALLSEGLRFRSDSSYSLAGDHTRLR